MELHDLLEAILDSRAIPRAQRQFLLFLAGGSMKDEATGMWHASYSLTSIRRDTGFEQASIVRMGKKLESRGYIRRIKQVDSRGVHSTIIYQITNKIIE